MSRFIIPALTTMAHVNYWIHIAGLNISLILPAVVVPLQTVKVGVHRERILPAGQDEVGVPVEALGPALCHADHAPVALAAAHIAVSGSCSTKGVKEARVWVSKKAVDEKKKTWSQIWSCTSPGLYQLRRTSHCSRCDKCSGSGGFLWHKRLRCCKGWAGKATQALTQTGSTVLGPTACKKQPNKHTKKSGHA